MNIVSVLVLARNFRKSFKNCLSAFTNTITNTITFFSYGHWNLVLGIWDFSPMSAFVKIREVKSATSA
jgi:hypothetical protein